jgi:hypothetical protein
LFDRKEDIQTYEDIYKQKHPIEISNTRGIYISIQELMDIAITPVLKQSVSTIISCLLDDFGYFEITKLFVTGSFLKIHDYNSIYDHIIITEMKKEFKRLIREKTYRTKLDLLIDTSGKQQKQSETMTSLEYKHFCFDAFTKGDLRVVANTTYMLNNDPEIGDSDLYFTSIQLPQFSENRNGLIIRGEELQDKTIKVDVHTESGQNDYFELYLCKTLISKTLISI